MQDITIDNPQETDFAWLAGILDGEGYVSICMNQHKHRKYGNTIQYLPRINIGSTSNEIIEKCKNILSKLVGFHLSARKLPSKKIFQTIAIAGNKRVGKILPFVLPYLTLKKANAERVLEFIELRTDANWPYTLYELGLIGQCKTGSSETKRKTPCRKGGDDDIVQPTMKVVGGN